jgi:bacteriocin biosynthesis cyclodehydratase domain-containing protein
MREAGRKQTVYLRPGLAVIVMPQAVQLRAGDEEICVLDTDSPDLVAGILHELAEGRTREQIERGAVPGRGDLVDAVIEQLALQRLLLNEPVREDDEIGVFLSHFQTHPDAAGYQSTTHVRRPTGPIAVTGHAKSRELLMRALAEHGIQTYEPSDGWTAEGPGELGPAEAAVCIWERPDLALAAGVNAAACRARVACLFADLSHGRHATLGPFYVPGEGACYECFRQRWRENSAAPAEFDAAESTMLASGQPLTAYGTLPAFRYQVVGAACGELFAFLSRHRGLQTLNRAITIRLDGLKLWSEPVWQIPWCPACGDAP